MTDEYIRQLETDVCVLTSLVAQLETKAQTQRTEIEHLHGAVGELRKEVVDLRARVEEVRHVGSAAHSLS